MAKKRVSQYDVAAPCVIAPPSPLNPMLGVVGFWVQTPGSAGVLTLNDCTTLAAASIANQILTLSYQDAAIGNMPLPGGDMPLTNGLVISAMPNGMVLTVVYEIYVPG
jgi:hypothetical protein